MIVAVTGKWSFDIDVVDCRNAFPPRVFFVNCVDTLANLGFIVSTPHNFDTDDILVV